jgi:hypothetical protein
MPLGGDCALGTQKAEVSIRAIYAHLAEQTRDREHDPGREHG